MEEQCREYERRSRALSRGLTGIGWKVPDCDGTMFVWAPIPENYDNSEKFAMDLAEKAGVIVVPGSSFGELGEGDVRLARGYPGNSIRGAVEAGVERGQRPGGAGRMFEALYEADINRQMIATSEIKISVLIDLDDADKAVQVVHDAFIK